MFPAYVRTVVDAVAYIDDWARATGGSRISGIAQRRTTDGLQLRQFEVEYGDGRVLSITLTLDGELAAVRYRFHLRRHGVLVWRLDKHPGHETEDGGPTHIHLSPLSKDRHPHAPVTFAEVADRLHQSAGG